MERLTFLAGNRVRIKTDSVDKLAKKLAEYEDLEDRLNGVSVKQVVYSFINTVKNQTNEEYEHGRILTNAEADKWNEYKQLEEQGLLLRLPCKVGTEVWTIMCGMTGKHPILLKQYFELSMLQYWGEAVFLTKEEAEQKLKEMESD